MPPEKKFSPSTPSAILSNSKYTFCLHNASSEKAKLLKCSAVLCFVFEAADASFYLTLLVKCILHIHIYYHN